MTGPDPAHPVPNALFDPEPSVQPSESAALADPPEPALTSEAAASEIADGELPAGEPPNAQGRSNQPTDAEPPAPVTEDRSVEPDPVIEATDDADPQAKDSDDAGDELPLPAPMLLTNRYNLLVCLGSRLVQPRSAYHKYYEDLLAMTPGGIPLLTSRPARDLIDIVSPTDDSFPILIEFGGLDEAKYPPLKAAGGGRVVEGAIPWDRVTAVHFPSQTALEEHLARQYANIRGDASLFAVNPDLFSGGTDGGEAWRDASTSEARDWDRADRIRGAINGVIAGVSSIRTLAVAACILGAGTGMVPRPESTLLDVGLIPSDVKPKTKSGEADIALCRAIFDVLRVTDAARGWSPRRVLTAIREAVGQVKPGKRDLTRIGQNLDRVELVVTEREDFTPFRQSAEGLTSAKALLLVMLRKDLSALLAWSESETGADDVTTQMACAFAGALRGLSREDVSLRPIELDDFSAEWAVRSTVEPPEGASISLTGAKSVLTVGDRVIATAPPPSARDLLNWMPGEELEQRSVTLSSDLGWYDLIETTIEWESEMLVTVREGRTVTQGHARSVARHVDPSRFLARVESDQNSGSALVTMILDDVASSQPDSD